MQNKPITTIVKGQAAEAVSLLRRFFFNRTDKVALKPSWAATVCPAEGGANLDRMLQSHLNGTTIRVRWAAKEKDLGYGHVRCRVGTYSPDRSGKTIFAVVDFDGANHGDGLADPTAAALAFMANCRRHGIPCYLERSRSCQGWHAWLFFAEPVLARIARQVCFDLMSEATRRSGEPADPVRGKGIEVFPKQDVLNPGDGSVGHQVWLPWYHGATTGGNQFYRVDDSGQLTSYMPDDFDRVSTALLAEVFPARSIATPTTKRPRSRAPVRAEGERIFENSRNSTLASLAGTMRRRGFSREAIAAALLVTNEQQCEPPLSESEVEGIARSIARYTPVDVPGEARLVAQYHRLKVRRLRWRV
jgi:hypothetical protein